MVKNMKRILVLCLILVTVFGFTQVAAEEVIEDNNGCQLIVDENGVILNLEEYEACLSQLVETCGGGNGNRGPRD